MDGGVEAVDIVVAEFDRVWSCILSHDFLSGMSFLCGNGGEIWKGSGGFFVKNFPVGEAEEKRRYPVFFVETRSQSSLCRGGASALYHTSGRDKVLEQLI